MSPARCNSKKLHRKPFTQSGLSTAPKVAVDENGFEWKTLGIGYIILVDLDFPVAHCQTKKKKI